jgi:hypothetical protein
MLKYGSLQPNMMTTSNQEKEFVAAVRKKKREQINFLLAIRRITINLTDNL